MENVIAYLYPFDESQNAYAYTAVHSPNNHSRLCPGKKMPELPSRDSRESTEPLDDSSESASNADTSKSACLQLTFTQPPKAGSRFVLGTDANRCDIVLPSIPTISRQHCYLTFDTQRRVIVRDCSTNGTIVTYDSEGDEPRSHFTWIVGGCSVAQNTGTIIIAIHAELKFKIVVPKPSLPEEYFVNVDKLLARSPTNASLHFGALGIQSNDSTEAHSEAHTPNKGRILLKQETIGEGAFSVVSRVWDVSTGFEYASKGIKNPQEVDWKKESDLMKQISHEHLVKLEFFIEEPKPQLVLEYLPLGHLTKQHFSEEHFSVDEVITILQQGLSALTYLHGRTPPIVHRDIKPENILLQSRHPLHIKLGDFGLSKASKDLVTFCGTHKYLAPEIARYWRTGPPANFKYTHKVDIWSFGVVILEYSWGLPNSREHSGLSWCYKIVDRLSEYESNSLIHLLSSMVVIDPQKRKSARDCLDISSRLDYSSQPTASEPNEGQTLQAGPAVTIENVSGSELSAGSGESGSQVTIKPSGTRQGSKRQRSCDGHDGNSRCSSKSFVSPAPSTPGHSTVGARYESVLKLLIGIQSSDALDKTYDPRQPALMDALCQQLERLQIARLRTHNDDVTRRTVITGIARSRDFIIARLTSSDLTDSIVDMARRLTRALESMSPEPTAVT